MLGMTMGVVGSVRNGAGAADPAVLPFSAAAAAANNDSSSGEQHPLATVRDWAQRAAARIENDVADYSAILLKREAEGGTLGEPQRLLLKIRHQPFSVYVYFYEPEDRCGDEAVYVDGRHEGNLLAHTTGTMGAMLGTLSLKPDGLVAMEGQRHPLTDIGILNLTQRIAQAAENGLSDARCQVDIMPGQQVDDRNCRCIQIRNPADRERYMYSQWRVYIDDQWDLPIRFEAYDWPAQPGAEPLLAEQYTYSRFEWNNDFTDADFDIRNPRYGYAEGQRQEAIG